MADRHVVGDTVRITNTFSVAGTPTDPTTVTLVVTDPSGNTEGTYTYGGATITKSSTGVYYKDLTVDEVGTWLYRWTGTGTVADVAVDSFDVDADGPDLLNVLSLSEARDVLGIDENSKDARLTQVITAISRRLDELCGPIVKRAISAKTYEVCGMDLWVLGPIYSTPAITLTEYDTTGAAQLLTLETYDTKPQYGYRLKPRDGLGGGYMGLIRRRSYGYGRSWGDSVRLAYTAGRYATTAAVDPTFKESAGVMLENWWQQVLPQPPQQGTELELPGFRFPADAIPPATLKILGDEAADVHALA